MHNKPGATALLSRLTAQTFLILLATMTLSTAWAADHIALSDEEKAWIAENPVIRLGVDPGWQPNEYLDADGTHQGIAADYVRILNERLGLNMTVSPNLTWSEVIEAIPDRDVDVLSAVARTDWREQYLTFTRPYMYIDWAVITRSDHTPVKTLEELAGRKTAVNEGYPTHQRLEANYSTIPLVPAKTTLEVLEKVIKGEAEAALVSINAATLVIHAYQMTNLRVDAHVFQQDDPIGFAVRKDWPLLVSILNKGLASISAEDHEIIRQRWLAVPINIGASDAEVRWIVLQVVAGMGLLIVLFMMWNQKLKSEIANRHKVERELADKNAQLGALAETDWLTGIANRAKIDHVLTYEIQRALRGRGGFALILMDIDHFKLVNDNHGHHVGDKVLIALAELVSKHVRTADIFGRWGGEEFMIVCPETDLVGARVLAENLRTVIAQFLFPTVGRLTSSFGVTVYKPDDQSKDLLTRVDQALYRAKSRGRNQTVTDEPDGLCRQS